MSPATFFGLTIARPEGYQDSDAFPGLFHPELESSIVVTRFDAPLDSIVGAFNPARMSQDKMQWLGQETFRVGDWKGRLVHCVQGVPMQGVQNVPERSFAKWIGIVGSDATTFLITATIPRDSSPIHSAELRQTILSVTIDEATATEQNSPPDIPLKFAIAELPPFRIAKQVRDQLVLTVAGTFPLVRPQDPLFVAGVGIGHFEPDHRRSFCRDRLENHSPLRSVVITGESELDIDGLPAFELLGLGSERSIPSECAIYQVILFDEDRYFIMQGIVDADSQANSCRGFGNWRDHFIANSKGERYVCK